MTKQPQSSDARASGQWADWSLRWRWVSRAADYDAHMAAVAQQAAEQVVAAAAVDWAARRSEQREREWSLAETLMERAAQMLRFPLQRVTTQTDDAGKQTTIIEPGRWSFADVARLAEAAAKLARLAAEMETDRTYLEVGPVDWAQVPDDITAAFADGKISLRDVQQLIQRSRGA